MLYTDSTFKLVSHKRVSVLYNHNRGEMKRKVRSNREKLEIALSGIKGMKVSTICNQYGINQSQHYAWRDQRLSKAETVFDADKKTLVWKSLWTKTKNTGRS